MYDTDTNKYLVYKTSNILGTNSENNSENEEKPISETERIEESPELKEYYETAEGNKQTRKTNGIYLIIAVFSLIGVILIVMYKKKNYA